MKTVVLFFEKGTPTRKVWFYQLKPGRNLGKTNPLNDADLTEFVELQKNQVNTEKSWSVDVATINSETYDLSVKNPNGEEEVIHRSPQEIIEEIPPLLEQQRIVRILEEAFEDINNVRANTEKSYKNSRALFESHLQSVFANAWEAGELVTLADLANDITDGDHMPPPKAESGVPFITIGNVAKDSRTIDFSNTFKVPQAYFDALKPNKKPRVGDVLYTVTGSFGIPVLIKERHDFCFQRHIGLVRPKSNVNSEWLYYLLMSPQVVRQAYDGATGTAQKTVSLKVLRGFKVPRITVANQEVAVAKLNTLTAETQRLESLYQKKLTALDALKKSLLHQAFTGDL